MFGLRLARITVRVLLIAGCIAAVTSVLAQSSGGDFELTKTTIDAGGGTASGADFQLTGTIAQPEASAQQSSGGEFIMAGGFWANSADAIFTDGFEGN